MGETFGCMCYMALGFFDKSAIDNMETNRHNYMGIQPYTHINKLERDSNEIIKSL